ncbi:PE-PGRS family protein [Kitasatospora sp. CM 4170]|uniref:PE-PGRS family protein n=1 Tax=Kitasatospora aburaviensis TaxID=67265 RepID=A0ABW1EPD5_9ACTN|nr:PE-PGRS family protein [Kitasatospora sp. CM 4170]WNM48476.1 PE-PGRS family protein [Kitasatospora sp. CM 4170]
MSVIVMTDRIRSLRAVVFAALCVALAATAHVAMAGTGVSAPVLAGAFTITLALTWLLAGEQRGLGLVSAWMVGAQTALHLAFEQAGAFAGGRPDRLGTTDWASLLLCNPDRAPAGLSSADLARMAGIDPDVPPAPGLRALAAGAHHPGAHGGSAAGATGPAGMGEMAGTGGMGGMGDTAGHGAAGHAITGHTMAGHGMSLGMVAAHLLAALACALLLWRGEAAVARLFDLLGVLGGVLAGALLAPLLALFARPLGFRPPAAPRSAVHRVRPPRLVLLTHALVRRGPPALAPAC